MHGLRGADAREGECGVGQDHQRSRAAVEACKIEGRRRAFVVHDHIPERKEKDAERLGVTADKTEDRRGGGDEERSGRERQDHLRRAHHAHQGRDVNGTSTKSDDKSVKATKRGVSSGAANVSAKEPARASRQAKSAMAIAIAAMTTGMDDFSGALSATTEVPRMTRVSTGVAVIVRIASASDDRSSEAPLTFATRAIEARVMGLNRRLMRPSKSQLRFADVCF